MPTKQEAPKEEQKIEDQVSSPKLEDILGQVVTSLGSLESRLSKLEDGGKNEFKTAADSKDVALHAEGRQSVDPRIVQVVDQMLGEDFGVELTPHADGRLGMLFTVIVPPRLSDSQPQQRPVKGEDGKYKSNQDGSLVYESYQPEDRRSRAISSTQSIDAIREHCERVRSYIVAYYQKMSKPLPEFKVK